MNAPTSSAFLHAPVLLAGTFVLALTVACGDSESSGGAGGSAGTTNPTTTKAASSGTGTGSTGSATSGSGSSASTSSGASTTASGSSGSGTGCDVPEPMFDGKDCLTLESATMICGFGSDEKICEFAVGCGVSTDVSSCKINCDQGSSSLCNTTAETTCMIDAFCTQDCAKLMTCGFIL